MTLRQAIGGDARGIHELVDQLLDGEDALLLIVDRGRAVSYAEGFGLSPCQLELLTIQIERLIRHVAGKAPARARARRDRVSDQTTHALFPREVRSAAAVAGDRGLRRGCSPRPFERAAEPRCR
jgi:hypothetical protein